MVTDSRDKDGGIISMGEQRFIPVDEEEMEEVLTYDPSSRKGRVSYSLVKAFLESGMDIAKMDRTGLKMGSNYYQGLIGGYIERHEIPVELRRVNGELYFIRREAIEKFEQEQQNQQKQAPKLTKKRVKNE